MRHQKKKITLDRKKGPRTALLKGLAANVILYEKVRTTLAKAKAVQPIVEKMISLGKQQSLHAQRQMRAYFSIENPVKKIVEDLAARYADRQGGYTRIIKLGHRQGDGAEMVLIELV